MMTIITGKVEEMTIMTIMTFDHDNLTTKITFLAKTIMLTMITTKMIMLTMITTLQRRGSDPVFGK